MLHALANPARFLRIVRPLTPILFWGGLLLVLVGVCGGLTQTPADYLQKESVRILYIHVPSAWLGMGGWSSLAIACFVYLVWKHPLASVAARAIAPVGALFAALCLITGSIWGRPTWGTWWQWDGRLTSMLLLFFIYIAWIALERADRERGGDGRIPALFGIAGTVLLPVIRYSVVWWNTLHQGQSLTLTGSSIDSSMLWPLLLTLPGFTLLFGGIVLMRMRTILAEQRVEARACEGWRKDDDRMNHWPFILVAYSVVAIGVGVLSIASWRAMRRAETAANQMRAERASR